MGHLREGDVNDRLPAAYEAHPPGGQHEGAQRRQGLTLPPCGKPQAELLICWYGHARQRERHRDNVATLGRLDEQGEQDGAEPPRDPGEHQQQYGKRNQHHAHKLVCDPPRCRPVHLRGYSAHGSPDLPYPSGMSSPLSRATHVRATHGAAVIAALLLATGLASCRTTGASASASSTANGARANAPAASGTVPIVINTERGDITVALDSARAPRTVTNFLRYVDRGAFVGGAFHRTVTPDNQPRDSVKIEVIQGRVRSVRPDSSFAPIAIEKTGLTGLTHQDGTISMARGGPNSATSAFFLTIGAQPSLDEGGHRNLDGQGFAAFGRVTSGMDIVRAIQRAPHAEQNLTPPIGIRQIQRLNPVRTADPRVRGVPLSAFPRLVQLSNNVYGYEEIRQPGFTTVSLVVVGTNGVLVADGQGSSAATKTMLDMIKTITPLPVKWYIVGSDHGDHTAGNDMLPSGITFVVHPNSRAQLLRDSAAAPATRKVIVPPVAMRSNREVIDVGGTRVEAHFLGRAHTGGDLVVYLPETRLLFMSEVYLNRVFPAMRSAYPSEWLATVDKALAMNVSHFIPGHGFIETPAVSREELVTFRESIRAVIAEVKRLHARGVPEEQAVKDASWGAYGGWFLADQQAPIAVRRIYAELNGTLK